MKLQSWEDDIDVPFDLPPPTKPSGWVCGPQWQDPDALFCPPVVEDDGFAERRCSLCGLQFIEPPQWGVRKRHMENVHKRGCCNEGVKVFEKVEHLHRHLEYEHDAILGPWIKVFGYTSSPKPVGQDTNIPRRERSRSHERRVFPCGECGQQFQKDQDLARHSYVHTFAPSAERLRPLNSGSSQRSPSVEEDSRDRYTPETTVATKASPNRLSAREQAIDKDTQADSIFGLDDCNTLMASSWDANLLCEWNSPRDRINRWLLHNLGYNGEHLVLHRQMSDALFRCSPNCQDMTMRTWSRLVIKYWFLDEAALGADPNSIMTRLDEACGVRRKANSSLRALRLFLCASTNVSSETLSGEIRSGRVSPEIPIRPSTPPDDKLQFWEQLEEALYKAHRDADRLRKELINLGNMDHLDASTFAPSQSRSAVFKVFDRKRTLLKERIDITDARAEQVWRCVLEKACCSIHSSKGQKDLFKSRD